ncbi:Maf family protein [Legionella impletisoli]|uniref:Nucleoside triphosphate pyrophosphatase n=1 Tax=Legionella impletisoli TaxID=343510 RepID=A0A917JY60_9GAMM|nr:Maf family nucleotide pyrophosphatase [Legionella impletisoli]GGI89661.1 Maf-like protein [Legionella impletisoli]
MSDLIHQAQLILASGSVHRHKLLKQVGLSIETHPSKVDEDVIKKAFRGNEYSELALQLAREKGLSVSDFFPKAGVIAADQLCLCENTILDKPLTHERAHAQLSFLSGKTHHLLSAVCLVYQKSVVWQHLDIITLSMRSLSSDVIDQYLKLDKPYQSCGSYHFEGLGKWLFEEATGNEAAIVGLPILPLLNALIEQGFVHFKT